MADSMDRYGNYIVIEYNSIVYNFPVVDTVFEQYTTEGKGYYGVYSVSKVSANNRVTIEASDVTGFVNSIMSNYTIDSFESFLRSNTGLTSGVYTLSQTGWASYVDTEYSSSSPLSMLSGIKIDLPNNAGTIIDSQKPSDVSSFYDGIKILGRNGDGMAIQVYFFVQPGSTNSSLDLSIDIGGSIGEIYLGTQLFRDTSIKGVMYALPAAYTLDTWEANGGIIKATPSANINAWGFIYNFSRTHKAR